MEWGKYIGRMGKKLIIKLFTKDNLLNCNNWRGITTQFLHLSRTSCLSPKYILYWSLQYTAHCQTIEWRTSLYLVFIDFQKAFDCVSYDAIWNVLRKRRPPKLITLISCFIRMPCLLALVLDRWHLYTLAHI